MNNNINLYDNSYEENKQQSTITEVFRGKDEFITPETIINENDVNERKSNMNVEGWFNFKTELKWFNIILIVSVHMIAVHSFLTFGYFENLKTTIWGLVMIMIQGLGVTGGAHRLWSHRAYKAKLPLRILLIICYSASGQNRIYDWVRDHRVHHKYTDTDADPHNSNRGFFFSHVGWLMMKKHPEVITKGRQTIMDDLLADPVIRFTERYFVIMKIVCAFIVPILVPVYGWNETWSRAVISQICIRYVICLNCTWSVNSVAHIWGYKPYNKYINPAENGVVAFFTFGEGWHNYHHVFPWDYKTAELGRFNFTTMVIDFFAYIGWAYDLKQPSTKLIKAVVMKNIIHK